MPRRSVFLRSASLRIAFVLAAALGLAACSSTERATQPDVVPPGEPAAVTLDPAFLAEDLGLDPAVRTGTLANGLTYYVRRNTEPEARAELRLAVNAGSILEDEDQRGLAHFVEHMAFNGTERFGENELVDFLEGLGMQFGPDLNAYTSFDETVYILQIPTDTTGLLDTGFDVLKEWAGAITLADEAIDRERGVVLEEWRQGRGASARINDQQFPILFDGSRYAVRLPIGDPDVLENAPTDALRRFYETWYRPDLMAVVAVGDFDPDAVVETIRTTFDGLENPAEPAPRPTFEVPGNEETRFAIATDPELTSSSVAVVYKEPAETGTDVAALRRTLTQRLYNRMLNARLYEETQRPDAPFLGAFTGTFGFARASDLYVAQAVVQRGGIPRGLEAVATEVERIERFGFTAPELERTKADLLRSYESAFAERENQPSSRLAGDYVSLFLEGEPAPGIEREAELVRQILPSIGLGDVNELASAVVGEENRVVLVSAPEDEAVPVPTADELRAVFAAVEAKDLEPYTETVSAEPLVAIPPAPIPIAGESTYTDDSGIVEYTLRNGARVVLKPTDFKADEVLLSAFSPGGTSLVPDSLFRAADVASAAANLGGVGAFSATDLDKKLAGQDVSVRPYVGEREEGFVGSASPEDLETLFQLVHLYFTAPRADADAFAAYRERLRTFVENRGVQPEAAFSDTLSATLAQYAPRRLPLTIDEVDALSLDEALGVYRDRFADASDFTFVLVGAFEPAAVRPLVEQYLATLPANGRDEAARDLGIRPPGGVVEKTVRRGIEPKARVQLVFSGALDARVDTLNVADSLRINGTWVPVADSVYAARHAAARAERYLLGALADALRIQLRDALREDRGGVYNVGVNADVDRLTGRYTVAIGFGTDPERTDELTAAVFDVIERFRQEGPEDALAKVKEADRRQQELALQENRTWLSALSAAYRYDQSPGLYLDRSDLIDDLSYGALRGAAQYYLKDDRYVKVVLLPEE